MDSPQLEAKSLACYNSTITNAKVVWRRFLLTPKQKSPLATKGGDAFLGRDPAVLDLTSMSVDSSSDVAMASMPGHKKLLLLACNAIPLVQLAATGGLLWLSWPSPWLCLAAVIGVVYVLPPLICRVAMAIAPIERQAISVGSRDFFIWWFTLNLQVLFCRFPFLEETLRLVPSFYSFWLRLWGAKIGKLTYWAAGVTILDRPWLEIGDHVIFGAGVRLNAHVFMPGESGGMVLTLAPIRIGHRVTVGGYSLLVAGTEIASGQCTRAFLILPPFSRLEDGRRVKQPHAPAGLATSCEGVDGNDL